MRTNDSTEKGVAVLICEGERMAACASPALGEEQRVLEALSKAYVSIKKIPDPSLLTFCTVAPGAVRQEGGGKVQLERDGLASTSQHLLLPVRRLPPLQTGS